MECGTTIIICTIAILFIGTLCYCVKKLICEII